MNKPIQDRVKLLLSKNPKCRDNDRSLAANIWYNELLQLGESKEKAYEFCKLYIDAQITPSDSITRARWKLQEVDPNLRGQSYHNRKDKEKEIRYQIVQR